MPPIVTTPVVKTPTTFKIILTPSFLNNECLKGVYDQLGGTQTFKNYLENFDGDFSVAHLKLTAGVDSSYPNANAVTYAPIDYVIEIKFNPNKLNRPLLDVSRTFIHELIHAEIYRKLLSIANSGGSVTFSTQMVESMRNDFPGLYDYYMRYYFNVPQGQILSDPQHQMMAQHYRGIIIDVMNQFDNTQTPETYEALSWIGLMGDGLIDATTGLPPNPTVAWNNVPQAQRLNLINVYNNYKTNNPPCQP